MYTGAALSFGFIRACRSGLVLYSIVLSDAGGEHDRSIAKSRKSLSLSYLKHQKTHYTVLTRKRKIRTDIHLCIDGNIINEVSLTKFLSVFLDNKVIREIIQRIWTDF